jgi:hypothetical protein
LISEEQLKRRFCEEAWQEQLNRSEAKRRKKLDQYRVAAWLQRFHLLLFSK